MTSRQITLESLTKSNRGTEGDNDFYHCPNCNSNDFAVDIHKNCGYCFPCGYRARVVSYSPLNQKEVKQEKELVKLYIQNSESVKHWNLESIDGKSVKLIRVDKPNGDKYFIFGTMVNDTWYKGLIDIDKADLKTYGMNTITDKTHTVLVVEGYKCVDSVRSIIPAVGYAVIGLMDCHSSFLSSEIPLLQGKEVIVLVDSDSNGREVVNRLSKQLGKQLQSIDLYPTKDDGSDVADWIDEGHTPLELIEILKGKPSEVTAVPVPAEEFAYYSFDDNGKISIDNSKFLSFLSSKGLRKEVSTYKLVKVNGNLVSTLNSKDIRYSILKEETNCRVQNWIASPKNRNFDDSYLESVLEPIEINRIQDTKDKTYIPFKNGVLEITKDSKRLIPYKDTNCLFFESEIQNRDWKENYYPHAEVNQFLSNIAGNHERLTVLKSILGYLINSHRAKSDKALILQDYEYSDKANGGTGKNLFVKMASIYRESKLLKGSKLQKDDNRFIFQGITENTRLLIIDEVNAGNTHYKTFTLDILFSELTEGITVEQKGKQERFIPFEKTPKFIFTTNKGLDLDGESHKRRAFQFGLSNYYNSDRTPYKEFGREFFGQEWTAEDWCMFDTLITDCIQAYHSTGLIQYTDKQESINNLKRFIGEDVFDYLESELQFERVTGRRILQKNLYNEFIESSNSSLHQKTFNKYTRQYLEFNNTKFSERQSSKGSEGKYWVF